MNKFNKTLDAVGNNPIVQAPLNAMNGIGKGVDTAVRGFQGLGNKIKGMKATMAQKMNPQPKKGVLGMPLKPVQNKIKPLTSFLNHYNDLKNY